MRAISLCSDACLLAGMFVGKVKHRCKRTDRDMFLSKHLGRQNVRSQRHAYTHLFATSASQHDKHSFLFFCILNLFSYVRLLTAPPRTYWRTRSSSLASAICSHVQQSRPIEKFPPFQSWDTCCEHVCTLATDSKASTNNNNWSICCLGRQSLFNFLWVFCWCLWLFPWRFRSMA